MRYQAMRAVRDKRLHAICYENKFERLPSAASKVLRSKTSKAEKKVCQVLSVREYSRASAAADHAPGWKGTGALK
jgi:hypothetical protein